MSNSVSTKDYPVKYFKVFFLEGGYAKYRDNFLMYCAKEEKAYPNFVKVFVTEIEIVLVQQSVNEIGEPTSETTRFTDVLYRDLKREVEESKNQLRDAQVEKFKDIDGFISSQRVILRDILIVNKDLFEKLPTCKKLLNELDDFTVNINPVQTLRVKKERKIFTPPSPTVYTQKKKVFNDEDTIKYSLFTGKDVKANLLKWLHTELCEDGIIEDFNETAEGEEQFIEIFASEKPQELEYIIKFRKNNYAAAIVFNKLKEYFENLTPTNIELSGCFYNKSGKPFTANDINVANTMIKTKSIRVDNEVRTFLNKFNENFLKEAGLKS